MNLEKFYEFMKKGIRLLEILPHYLMEILYDAVADTHMIGKLLLKLRVILQYSHDFGSEVFSFHEGSTVGWADYSAIS